MSEGQSAGTRKKRLLPEWALRVVDSRDAAPNMRRVTFTAENIADLDYLPGQSLVFDMPLGNGETGRRHYTIRALDRNTGELAVDFLLHGQTPSPTWACNARPGDTVVARGPRGKVVFDTAADWHILAGDETCIPAIAHILETKPAAARVFAFIETDSPAGEIPIAVNGEAEVRWLHRHGVAPGQGDLMADTLASFPLPEGLGRACIIGETGNVRRQRHLLIARGLTRDQFSCEAYWRPGRLGGHDHVDD